MKFNETSIPDVILIEPKIFEDERGYFFESFRLDLIEEKIGEIKFVQANESKSTFGTMRGLHYQLPPTAQSKLVRVIQGKVLDVAVDIRKNSKTFGQYVAEELSDGNKKQMFIPRGFAHGFLVLSDYAVFHYMVDNYYSKEDERGIIYNDPEIGIEWGIETSKIILSGKDKTLPSLKSAGIFSEAE